MPFVNTARGIFLGIICISFSTIAHAIPGMPKYPLSIYGEDHRKDVYELSEDAIERSWADSTVALFLEKRLEPIEYDTLQMNGHNFQALTDRPRYSLKTRDFTKLPISVFLSFNQLFPGLPGQPVLPNGQPNIAFIRYMMNRFMGSILFAGGASVQKSFPLCKDERFYGQPLGAYCSGSLIAPDLILTAGHCVETEEECEDTRLVFGYHVKEAGQYPREISKEEVYSCTKLVYQEVSGSGADFGILKLDRPVLNHKALKMDLSGNFPVKGQPLTVVGHPVGMPVKVSAGAKVRDVKSRAKGYFTANLDTFEGNSGSPVFNQNNGLVNGVLVRGADDFHLDKANQCVRATRYSENDLKKNEAVTQISRVVEKLRELQRDGILESNVPGLSADEKDFSASEGNDWEL